jgi:glutamate racemase
MLSGLLQLEMGPQVVLVSSAEETAKDVYGTLMVTDVQRDAVSGAVPPDHVFLCTGDPARFRALAGRFLGPQAADVRAARVEPAASEAGAGGGRWS